MTHDHARPVRCGPHASMGSGRSCISQRNGDPSWSGDALRCEKGGTMWTQNGISRRQALGMAVAGGGLAIIGRVRGALAQAAKRIEQLAPELDQILSPSEPIQELATGFGGD